MSKTEFYIQPLEQIWAHIDPIYEPKKVIAIDRLDDELGYRNQIITHNGTDVRSAVARAIENGWVKPGGWIRITASRLAQPEELWPLAMKALGAGKTETFEVTS